jgi:diadenosine tetraphosphate (Ap4A) HIT family hydrolase
MCLAIKNSVEPDKNPWNTPLRENDTFIILPSLGPLIEGQAIIVSKEHKVNLLSMTSEELLSFSPFIDYSQRMLGNNILFAEHGSFLSQTGGSCIEHTHVHILPHFENYFDALDDVLPISNAISGPVDLKRSEPIDFPYILTFNLKRNYRLYKAYNAHSQMIRKVICLKEGRDDWDWKAKNALNLIDKTIQLWKKN